MDMEKDNKPEFDNDIPVDPEAENPPKNQSTTKDKNVAARKMRHGGGFA